MTPDRTRVLLLVGLVVTATVVVGTGAFTAATAPRGAEVAVVSDLDAALLGLAPAAGPNGAFAQDTDGDGTLELELDGDATGVLGAGPNADALTRLDAVFTVTNHGTRPVAVWLDDGGVGAVLFRTDDGVSIEGSTSARTLRPGESLTVGITVDTRGVGEGTVFLTAVVVHADADAAETLDTSEGGSP